MNLDAFPETVVDPGVDNDKRYTTPETMALCMKLAGVDAWDVDVAADEESHWADTWYGVEKNGLKQPWVGRVWCNPPWSNIEPWLRKANYCAFAVKHIVIGMLLPANRTEQSWWQDHIERSRDTPSLWLSRDGRSAHAGYQLLRTHFLPTRVRYGHPGNPKGLGVGSPPFGSVLLVWRGE